MDPLTTVEALGGGPFAVLIGMLVSAMGVMGVVIAVLYRAQGSARERTLEVQATLSKENRELLAATQTALSATQAALGANTAALQAAVTAMQAASAAMQSATAALERRGGR